MVFQSILPVKPKRGFKRFLRYCKSCGTIFRAPEKGVKICLGCRTTQVSIMQYIKKSNKRR
jgi:hypothetical protein